MKFLIQWYNFINFISDFIIFFLYAYDWNAFELSFVRLFCKWRSETFNEVILKIPNWNIILKQLFNLIWSMSRTRTDQRMNNVLEKNFRNLTFISILYILYIEFQNLTGKIAASLFARQFKKKTILFYDILIYHQY